jgi:hypothetical protein
VSPRPLFLIVCILPGGCDAGPRATPADAASSEVRSAPAPAPGLPDADPSDAEPPDATPPTDASLDDDLDAGPPADVLAAFARLAPTMSDCIALTPAGRWMTFEVDVTWHLDPDGRITGAHVTRATGYCHAAVVERRLEALRFARRARAYDGTYRFVFHKFV